MFTIKFNKKDIPDSMSGLFEPLENQGTISKCHYYSFELIEKELTNGFMIEVMKKEMLHNRNKLKNRSLRNTKKHNRQ